MLSERRGVSVVVPVYNSAATLELLIERVTTALELTHEPFEIILVNDGSRDDSWNKIKNLAQRDARVFGVNLMRNFGQHNALLAGIRTSQYTVTVTIDDDLQHPPEEIVKLLAKLDEGYDVVYGVPKRLPHSPWRNFTSWLMKQLMSRAMNIEGSRRIGAFRAFRTDLRNAFSRYRSPMVSLDVLLGWGTTSFGWVKVKHDPRRVGKSNYNLRKLLHHALTITTGFSTGPLRFASFIGFAFTAFGLAVLSYVIALALLQGSIPGFPFLASIISIFSGAQLFALGIIGEYIAIAHQRMMDRPIYVIREHAHSYEPARATHSRGEVETEVVASE
jgi:undecaprenyl-phosphate 4-deoxy-4-formamido-L-arabinose transferase